MANIPCVPDFCEYTARAVEQHTTLFQHCLLKFDALDLRLDFATACDAVPRATFCCGLLPDDEQTILDTKTSLEAGWVKNTNRILKRKLYTFQVDVFMWGWHNALGKAEINIMLIRFMAPHLKKEGPRGSISQGVSKVLSA
jgi:hypothetical protein